MILTFDSEFNNKNIERIAVSDGVLKNSHKITFSTRCIKTFCLLRIGILGMLKCTYIVTDHQP